ncbi:recombinase family protein [Actinomadura luteofluorescens]
MRGAVVQTIFEIRIAERLGYEAIADRLNVDLERYPAPVATVKTRTVGRWTYSSVRDVLSNPKYTGYMVWNRKATSSAGGRNNPPEAWAWSSEPTHPGLVSVKIFVEAQQVALIRRRSRSRPGRTNVEDTEHPYVLRSYITCADCERRMFGKNDRWRLHHVCGPNAPTCLKGIPQSCGSVKSPSSRGRTTSSIGRPSGPIAGSVSRRCSSDWTIDTCVNTKRMSQHWRPRSRISSAAGRGCWNRSNY